MYVDEYKMQSLDEVTWMVVWEKQLCSLSTSGGHQTLAGGINGTGTGTDIGFSGAKPGY